MIKHSHPDSVPRIEGPQKVCGSARYVAEHEDLYPDLHHAVVLGATIAAGKIRMIDSIAAERAEGVIAVLTCMNAPRLIPVDIFPRGPAGERQPPLQEAAIYYAGQAVALVIARTPEQAQYAADLIHVHYDVLPASSTWGMLAPDASGEAPPTAMAKAFDLDREDSDAALAASPVRVSATIDTPAHSQSAMELAATLVAPDPARGPNALIVHDSTQWVLGCRNMLARTLGLPLDDVRVLAPFVGGGFGAKCFTWPHTVLAAMAARLTQKPVRLVLSRAQMHLAAGSRPAVRQHIEIGSDTDGKLLALRQSALSQTSINDSFLRAVGEVAEVLYEVPALQTRHRLFRTHTGTPTNMRAPAESYGSFALETALDQLAEQLKLDPLELRLRNLPERHPEDGVPFTSNAFRQCLIDGAKAFGWERRPLQPRSKSEGREWIGWGMAGACYGGYRSQAEVRASLLPDGRVEVASATHEIGSGTSTLMAQIAASALQLPVAKIRVVLGDTLLPAAPVHGASRNAATIGPAVKAACEALAQAIAERGGMAALLAQIKTAGTPNAGQHGAANAGPNLDQYAGKNAELNAGLKRGSTRGAKNAAQLDPTGQAILSVVRRAGPAELNDAAFATLASGINTLRFPKTATAATFAYAAHFAEVRVRPELGQIRVTRLLSRCDIGQVINPMQARSQILGGLVFGLGMALTEQIVPDPATGRVISAGITEYWLPGMSMQPEFDIGFVGEADFAANEVGAKGAGELGTVGSAAAIANAVWHATGHRFQQLPMTLDKIIMAGIPAV